MEAIEVMRTCKKFVVIGLKNDPEKYVYKIYKRLLNANYETYAVSSYIDEMDGNKVYKQIKDLPVVPEVAVFVVAPKNGYAYLEECKDLNIPHLWFQPGTYDDAFIARIEEFKMTYYLNCVLRRLDELENIKID